MWHRHQLIITTLSPPAKRFNQCHRANFRSPLALVPSFRPPLPLPFLPDILHSLPPSLAYQGGSSAGNYVVHDRNAGGSRNLSVSRLDAPPEIVIPIFPPRPSLLFTARTGLNDARKSITSISLAQLSLVTHSHASLIARYLSLLARGFILRHLRQFLRARCLFHLLL